MINISGPINQLGYGITCLNIVKSLSKVTNVCFFPIGNPQVTNQEDADIVRSCINKAQMLNFNAPSIKIWHQHDMSQFPGNGLRIGFPIFELDTFNQVEIHHLSSLDKIFVCSSWAKSVILNNIKISDKNVFVIPLGVDQSIFKLSDMPQNTPTRFYNCGKWEIRKGHDILVSLFNEAFEDNDSVELYLMCDNPFCSKEEQQEWINLYKKSKLGNKIHIIPRQSTQEEVYNIMKEMHCGIFPARAEGWNLELLEMLSCGKHVITTNYAAHKDFCNTNNSLLVDIDSLEKAYDGKWFFGQGNWAKIDQNQRDQFIKHMRFIHNQNITNSLSINKLGAETSHNFTWDNTSKEILNAIQTI